MEVEKKKKTSCRFVSIWQVNLESFLLISRSRSLVLFLALSLSPCAAVQQSIVMETSRRQDGRDLQKLSRFRSHRARVCVCQPDHEKIPSLEHTLLFLFPHTRKHTLLIHYNSPPRCLFQSDRQRLILSYLKLHAISNKCHSCTYRCSSPLPSVHKSLISS